MRSAARLRRAVAGVLFCISLGGTPAVAQVASEAKAAATSAADPLVTMEFPDDGIELSLLADIVTRRLHVPILYDDAIRGKKVIIRVPTKVPESSLLGILQSALRLKQMALVDAEQPGWKQIVAAPSLAAVARPTSSSQPASKTSVEGAIAQAFLLAHSDPAKIADLVRPFLSTPGGYVQAEVGQKVLLVSDYASVVRRVALLIQLLDNPIASRRDAFCPDEAG